MRNSFFNLPSRKYQVFVSHSWDYADEYEGVVRLLDSDTTFSWFDLSIPIENPVPHDPLLKKSTLAVVRELEKRIREADCLLVLAAMYFNHSEWIQFEIDFAKEINKPIIAVKPWGQERVPEALQQVAVCDPVWCATGPLIAAIKRHAVPASTPEPSFSFPDYVAQLSKLQQSTNTVPSSTTANLAEFPNLAYLASLAPSGRPSEVPTSDSQSFWNMLAESFEPPVPSLFGTIPLPAPNKQYEHLLSLVSKTYQK
jgi:hypothetical protein